MSLDNSTVVPSLPTDGYTIDQSLRFNRGDSAYLSWTPSSAGNRQKFTWSGWFKRTNIDSTEQIFSTGDGSGSNQDQIRMLSDGRLSFASATSDNNNLYLQTTAKYRDVSSWYHIVISVDSTQATSSNRAKIYVNGEQVTDFDNETYCSQNYNFRFNNTVEHNFGRLDLSTDNYFNGYLAEVHFIDGQQLDPASFGKTGTYGEWKPKAYSGTYGTNGFYLPFEWNPTYGSATLNTNDIFGDSSIIATYQLNSNADDLGSNYDATATNVNWIGGKFGYAAEFASSSGTNNSSVINTGGISGLTSTFSVSMWVKLYTDTNYRSGIVDNTSDNAPKIMTHENEAGITFGEASYRCNTGTLNNNQWYHLVFTLDGTDGKIYKDGSLYSTGTFSSSYNTGHDFKYIGHSGPYLYNSNNSFRGAIDQIRIFDRAVTSSEVTELYQDGDTPITSGAFYNDASGNSNNFTETNLSETDVVLDSPTNNFCIWNPLTGLTDEVYSEGNTIVREKDSYSGYSLHKPTMQLPSTGKWYAEFICVGERSNDPSSWLSGVIEADAPSVLSTGVSNYYYGAGFSTGDSQTYKYGHGTYATSDTVSHSLLDVVQVAVDIDNMKVWIGHNNTWLESGNPASGTNALWTMSSSYAPYAISASNSTNDATRWKEIACNYGQDSSFAGNKTAQGNTDGNGIGDFYYTPPSGYLALCTANLPDPAVIPSENFNTVLWTGTGAGQSITGVGFQPDWVWTKARSSAKWNMLYDVVRGGGYYIGSNDTQGDATDNQVTFDSDGFTSTSGTESVASGVTYVGWFWKANGSGVSNTNGSITSTVSANQDAGFSIVSYTGNGNSSATTGHGLSQRPDMVMYKSRSSNYYWMTYHESFGNNDYIYLNDISAKGNHASVGSIPTSTVLNLGDNTDKNASSGSYIAYCFHSVDGFSKVGSYTGNGSTDGTFVYTGFRPAWIMIKRTDSTSNWTILDNKREGFNASDGSASTGNDGLDANNSGTEGSADQLDILSNGFKRIDTSSSGNASGGSYIYMAFAENPFKYTNAR